MSSDIKIKVQSFGRFLSNMVMPNIGAFIAWGIITALFIPTGWLPNETLAKLVGPMITYLLPLLIGYTGGKLVGGERGGVVGAITTMGVIVGADMPMFLGSMIAGPLGDLSVRLKLIYGLGVINRQEYEDAELLMALREELNHDGNEYAFTDDEILGPFGELHCVAALPPPPQFEPADSSLYAMQIQRYQQAVRSTMVLSLTELISRISLKKAFQK